MKSTFCARLNIVSKLAEVLCVTAFVVAPIATVASASVLGSGFPGTAARQVAQQPATSPAASGGKVRYEDISGWFSIELPRRWLTQDVSNDFARMLRVDDPDSGSVLIVRAQLYDSAMTADQRIVLLRTVIGLRFRDATALNRSSAIAMADGSLRMDFEYLLQTGLSPVVMRGQGVLRTHGEDYVSVVAFAAPANGTNRLMDQIRQALSSFSPQSQALDPDALSLGMFRGYRDPGGEFEISVPVNWDVSDESTAVMTLVKFYDYANRAGVFVQLMPTETAAIDQRQLTDILDETVILLYSAQKSFAIQPANSLAGRSAEVYFSYQALVHGRDTTMIGRCAARHEKSRIAIVCVILSGRASLEARQRLGDVDLSLKILR